ncbi:GIY-YIG nuclease family protein [Arthrobacter sp. GMC3]|uniref:GIY-YIG nuclease family protein n=1 Tax=Arthrobacter sp. GMC3 TaxID=2058894 RepID=UPI000CE5794C|nr:GIY-YIG nuclease family protein [Arthrobacter sp. GMC3]
MTTTITQLHPKSAFEGSLTMGELFAAAGIDPSQVVLLRHTYSKTGLTGPADLSPAKVLAFVREQAVSGSWFPKNPPLIWLNFIAAGGTRGRFIGAFENHGEVMAERTETERYYDLSPSPCLASFKDRLVIDWTGGAIRWTRAGEAAVGFPVTEIADAQAPAFPGFDELILSFNELHSVIEDSRYEGWRQVLKSVQGIYLISDTKSGKLYVGKADGSERIMGRWSTYAKTGHGGNVALRELNEVDMSHRNHFQFSILRVFSPGAPKAEIDAAENHYKRALLSKQFGLNRN